MDEKNVLIVEDKAVQPVTEKTLTGYLQAFGLVDQLSKSEVMQFVEIAKAYNLNPFKREIYCVPYGSGDRRRLSIITGYETYLKRAERTGLLDGWEATIEGTGRDMKAVVRIYRKGWNRPFVHEVFLSEYDQKNSMWQTKPKTMLKKVAIAQAFRLCFPEDIGGMPYTDEELPEELTTIRDVTPPEEIVSEIKDLNKQIAEVKSFIPDSMLTDLKRELKKLGNDANEAQRVKNMCAAALSFGLAEKQKKEAPLPKCAQPIEHAEPEPDVPVFHLEGFPDEEDFADDSAELYEEER